MKTLLSFLCAIESDPRITTAHISVYVSLWKKWQDSGGVSTISIFRTDVAAICKISSNATYHRVIRQLHEYGYIRYTPSYNHFAGSEVCFMEPKM